MKESHKEMAINFALTVGAVLVAINLIQPMINKAKLQMPTPASANQ
jgi:hypothetical protein